EYSCLNKDIQKINKIETNKRKVDLEKRKEKSKEIERRIEERYEKIVKDQGKMLMSLLDKLLRKIQIDCVLIENSNKKRKLVSNSEKVLE
ncbi:28255_t:CDS:2, partial [Gigaspora margarita]